jgi:hypothetical protein
MIPTIPLGAHLDAAAMAAQARAAVSEPTPADYKREREKRGTQVQVAAMLGVHPITIANRETCAPDGRITREAWLALLSLPMRDEQSSR